MIKMEDKEYNQEDGFKLYQKKQVVVKAKRMEDAFKVETLENNAGETMHGKAGDYLIIGIRGEKYPCDAEIFHETYVPYEGFKYTDREILLIRFMNKYENLCREDRKEIACYVDRKPYTWNVVFLEIINKTELSQRMLEKVFK